MTEPSTAKPLQPGSNSPCRRSAAALSAAAARRKFPGIPRVQRLLVRSPNWVGDAVMSLPVLSGLGGFFPRRRSPCWRPGGWPLFQGLPGVTEVVPYPAGRGKWQVLWDLRGRFDLALALPNSLESALGLWLVGVPLRVGYAADARRPLLNLAVSGRRLAGLHLVFYYLGLLQALEGVETFTPPTLYLREPRKRPRRPNCWPTPTPGSGPWVGLSPGAAYGPAKRWPPEHFAAVGRELATGIRRPPGAPGRPGRSARWPNRSRRRPARC